MPENDYDDEEAPNATMETKVSSGAQPKRVGKWTLAQLRQTDGIIPSQAGWNKGDSQKLMTNFGTPRNTTTKVRAECLADVPEEIALKSHGEVRLQSGTNRYASQRGMTGFGTGRDVCREGVHVSQDPADLEPLPEEKIRASDGIVRLQSGTNKFDSQKGMTGFGTARRETTKMKDNAHPEYDHERSIDQSEIPLQSGTNKFASQKGMTGFGTNRRETTKMVDTSHPEYSHESSIDQTSIPYQMGSNRYASQKGMTGFGQPRWEVLDPSISYQNRKSQGMVRLQSGTNRFASQAGMTGFGTPRNTTYEAEAGELPYDDMKKSEAIIPSQAGWNKGDSQKLMTGFGTPRVLLLMGGGMGAGKSTVLKDILKEAFWSGASANSVVVEADAFKETDVIYRAISSRGHHNDMLQTAELVHQSSLDAASSLLVTALNEGRDVIMDGTLSWEPFVQQTIAMARDVHRQRYRMGRGYKVSDDGTITEEYWEPVEAEDSSSEEENEATGRKPYRIELVGVVCDPYLAVVRGIRRAVITGRAVRVKSQLQSHKRFATAFRSYCSLVDNARLYSTNTLGSAKLIGWKDGGSNLLVDPEEIGCLERVSSLNEEADCVHELYADGQPTGGSSSVWQDLIMSPSRWPTQRELKAAIEKGEARFRPAVGIAIAAG